MDQEKIGKFIAENRKIKKLTQRELAEKLGVTDRSVSKWENGNCMPDMSLLAPLSKELGVSVNDLLSGKKNDKEDYQEAFEENIVNIVSKVDKDNKKFILIILIVIASLAILGTIFYIMGTVDYIRATNGKRPIFVYRMVNVPNPDVNKEGTEYYGIGYKISLCDNQKENYIFQLGHKQKKLCYTNLTCSETYTSLTDSGEIYTAKNDKHIYNFSFFDDRLYLINSTYLIPTSSIENEETWAKEMLKYFDVPGVHTSIKKINETTYEMKQSCNLPEMLKAGSKNVCSIDYFGQNVFGLTRTEIDDYYYKDTCK